MTSTSCVVACIKWAPPHGSGSPEADERFTGMSLADGAALELALRTGDMTGDDVVVVTIGPQGAERIAREALACGAARAIRVDAPVEADTVDCASAAADVLRSLGSVRLVWCGDYSTDRGSGSFPAFLAAHMDLEQALGLIRVDFPSTGVFPVHVVRRLDGGRRERATVHATAVLSVEGSLASLRRASLSRTLATRAVPVEVVTSNVTVPEGPVTRPYRPRARTIPAPSGASPLDRIRAVTEAAAPAGSGEPIELDPVSAAELILERLHTWGYLQ